MKFTRRVIAKDHSVIRRDNGEDLWGLYDGSGKLVVVTNMPALLDRFEETSKPAVATEQPSPLPADFLQNVEEALVEEYVDEHLATVLSVMVHEHKANEAGVICGGGFPAQLAYLINTAGVVKREIVNRLQAFAPVDPETGG